MSSTNNSSNKAHVDSNPNRRVAVTWYRRASEVGHSHYRAALYYSKLNRWLGVPTILFTAIVGTSLFASIQAEQDLWIKIGTGLLSVAAAALGALQTFFASGNEAERRRAAGAAYNSVGRQLESLIAKEEWNRLDEVRTRIDTLAHDSPHIPEFVHKHWALPDRSFLWLE